METFSALLAICAGYSPVTGEFPSQGPVTRSFDVFFGLRLNKRLSKESWGWWFETPSRPLGRHCNVARILHTIRVFYDLLLFGNYLTDRHLGKYTIELDSVKYAWIIYRGFVPEAGTKGRDK